MARLFSFLGVVVGMVALTAAYLNPPSVNATQAREESMVCHNVDVSLDEGYGVSKHETRLVCGKS